MKNLGLAVFLVILLVSLLSCGTPAPANQTGAASFTGEGGRGIRLAVLVPDAIGLPDEEDYLPALVQGVLVGDFSRFSDISVLDRLSLESVLAETESGIYQTEEDFGRLGEIANVDYVLTGSITRTGAGHALQVQIVGTGRDNIGVTRASFSGTPTVAEMDDFTGIRRASMELLTQMGVALTDTARQELAGVVTQQSIHAQIALAQGHHAQRAGTEVVALSYFIQAAILDPTLIEAVDRQNILSASISTGNIGEDIRNDIQWRDQWVAGLNEVADVFSINTTNMPFYIVYSTDIEHVGTDFANRTAEFRTRISIIHDADNFIVANRVMRTVMGNVQDGLAATGRANDWGLDNWLRAAGWQAPLPQQGIRDSSVEVELLNANGQSLSRQIVRLRHGWQRFNNQRWYHAVPVYTLFEDVVFRSVDAELITSVMTIRINSVDGIPAEDASRQRRLSILTEHEYNNIANVQANGLDISNLTRFGIDNVGRLTVIAGADIRGVQRDGRPTRIAVVNAPSTLVIPYGVVILTGDIRYRGHSIRLSGVTEIVIPESVSEVDWRGDFPDMFTGSSISVTIPDSVAILRLGGSIGPLNRITVPADLAVYTVGGEWNWATKFNVTYRENNRRAGTYYLTRWNRLFNSNRWRFTS